MQWAGRGGGAGCRKVISGKLAPISSVGHLSWGFALQMPAGSWHWRRARACRRLTTSSLSRTSPFNAIKVSRRPQTGSHPPFQTCHAARGHLRHPSAACCCEPALRRSPARSACGGRAGGCARPQVSAAGTGACRRLMAPPVRLWQSSSSGSRPTSLPPASANLLPSLRRSSLLPAASAAAPACAARAGTSPHPAASPSPSCRSAPEIKAPTIDAKGFLAPELQGTPPPKEASCCRVGFAAPACPPLSSPPPLADVPPAHPSPSAGCASHLRCGR